MYLALLKRLKIRRFRRRHVRLRSQGRTDVAEVVQVFAAQSDKVSQCRGISGTRESKVHGLAVGARPGGYPIDAQSAGGSDAKIPPSSCWQIVAVFHGNINVV